MSLDRSSIRAPERQLPPAPEDRLAALERVIRRFSNTDGLVKRGGLVTEVTSTHYKVRGLSDFARLGDIVEQRGQSGARRGEIVKISRDEVVVAPFERSADAGIGDAVFRRGPLAVAPHDSWRGRTIDALTRAIDGGAPLIRGEDLSGGATTPGAMARQRVGTAFMTGVKVIDIFTPLCFGQRMGVFAGSGVGKSTLLAMLAGADAFDTVVVALIGERGREVREFLEDTIGDSMAKTVAVVATSDESAMMRRRAPDTAMRVAEHFRDQGHRVLLVLDSITRFAHALREVATGTGEPPVARGYPASVFTELPKLLERAGPGAEGKGSITAIISVLVDGDDHNDPVADSVRGILDGHVVLDRAIAEQGRYPPVNPLSSISRLAGKAWSVEQRALVTRLKSMIARFEDTRDIRLLGAYQGGADAELDIAVRQVPLIYEALTQSPRDRPSADPFSDLARHLKGKLNAESGD
ncbi:flagellum-specific ATP synthase FliI [Mesorhizobium sp. WSM4312]|uniref:flagellar protein export ATPase FliI n=1 Tax=unclassified Mesorhizobium TaxID=325217 RepID=UPI000BAE80B8|nr:MULTISPECIES: flagellar protein export ATPase FliI [unclassified Mesorhizobium]PBB26290.1 flagellum-specific ATP synthase FliI [Mesorhizobium sp. WSM4304]PBB69729.1 flagellum-specific ATP synthase FliI [Mesorhizobium sp. WSM4312]PBB75624.1 flagellum-specific ATP synthase FliI [Mesorhizobium sp. WSM4308]PBC21703.1 flagellum-specific ATP synthase FliI [Mesorhizobium sp. WSM4311]TRC81796.1 flagellar protein export ATPase FliI [Mesorhizobium sp. WSM4315]